MIDTDKYEPTQMDWILHNTREHSPDGWRKLSKSLIELSDDNRLLIEYAPKLLAEVKRLREQIVDMIDSMDNYYIRDIQHATDCLRDMIGYYEDEEE